MDRIYLDLIEFNPWQPRQVMDGIEELAADILSRFEIRPETSGLLQVPAVRIVDPDGDLIDPVQFDPEDPENEGLDLTMWLDDQGYRAQLAYGHRRFMAFQHLHNGHHNGDFLHMPVEIVPFTDEEMATVAWSENEARKNLTGIEQAQAIHRMILDFNWTQDQAAQKLNMARSTLANKLRLLNLPDELQEHAKEGRISERQAMALLPIYDLPEDLYQQAKKSQWGNPEKLIQKVLDEDISADEIRSEVNYIFNTNTGDLTDEFFNLDHSFDHPDLVSPVCNQCPARVRRGQEMRCPSKACRSLKKDLWKVYQVQMATEESGIPALEIPEEENFWEVATRFSTYDNDQQAGAEEALGKVCPNLRLEFHPWGSVEKLPGNDQLALVCHHSGERCACVKKAEADRAADAAEAGESDWERQRREANEREKKLFDEVIQPAAKVLAERLAEDPALGFYLLAHYLFESAYFPKWLELPKDAGQADISRGFIAGALVSSELEHDAPNDLAGAKLDLYGYLENAAGISIPEFAPTPLDQLEVKLARIAGWVREIDEDTPIQALNGNLENLDQLWNEWGELPETHQPNQLTFGLRCEELSERISEWLEAAQAWEGELEVAGAQLDE